MQGQGFWVPFPVLPWKGSGDGELPSSGARGTFGELFLCFPHFVLCPCSGANTSQFSSAGSQNYHFPNTQEDGRALPTCTSWRNLSPAVPGPGKSLRNFISPQAALPQTPSPIGGVARARQGEAGGQGNHFKPSLPFPASCFTENKTARRLWLPTAPLGAVKINPALPVLKGNTDTNGDRSLRGQKGVQEPWRGRVRQPVRPPNP